MPNLKNERGQGLVEYILIVFLMAVIGIAAVRQLSDTTTNGFKLASERLDHEFAGK